MNNTVLQANVLDLLSRVMLLEQNANEGRPNASSGLGPSASGVPDAALSILQEENRLLKKETKLLKLQVSELNQRVSALESEKKDEVYYQEILEKELSGKHIHISDVGTTDITTDDAHIEIKRWTRSHEVIGQLAKYQKAMPKQRSCVYFFGPRLSSKKTNDIVELMQAAGIEMYSFDHKDNIERHESVAPCETGEAKVFKDFIENNLVRVVENGVLSREHAITHKSIKQRFISSFEEIPPTKDCVDRFLRLLGPVVKTTKSRNQYYSMVGSLPQDLLADAQVVPFRGFFGWRWKMSNETQDH